MIETVIIVLAVLWLFNRGGFAFAAQSPVINQATGASLSGTLGTQAAPPSYFTSGNPGYNTPSGPSGNGPATVIPVAPALPPSMTAARTQPPALQNNRPPVPVSRVTAIGRTSVITQRGGGNRYAPIPQQPVAIRTRTSIGPETATSFWTKPAYPRALAVFAGPLRDSSGRLVV